MTAQLGSRYAERHVLEKANFFSSFLRMRYIPSCGVRLPVCLSVCLVGQNRFFSQAYRRIVTKLAHNGRQVCLHLGCARGQGQGQRSRDRGNVVVALKLLLLLGKWTDPHQTCTKCMVPRSVRIQDMCSRSRSKVTIWGQFTCSKCCHHDWR